MAMTEKRKNDLPPPRFVALPTIVLTARVAGIRPSKCAPPYHCAACGGVFGPEDELLGRDVPAYKPYTGRAVTALLHKACDTTWLIGLSAPELAELERSGRGIL